MMIPSRSWALEQNDRRTDFVTGPAGTMFAESDAFEVAPHCHPAWKVVLPLAGQVEVGYGGGTVTAAGMIIPPQLVHTCATSSAYVALFFDPWMFRHDPGPTRLDAAGSRRVLAALGPPHQPAAAADLAAAHTELADLIGAGALLDRRLARAVQSIQSVLSVLSVQEQAGVGSDDALQAVASDAGISAPRLRALARTSVGVPLTRLRQWARLRVAVTELPRESAAAAAAFAGFADQAHFTRTARRLLGRTPSSITRPAL
ncbi:helix-turn-helix domain-containing protein [Streptomyces sp. NPDC050617]|uniref:helix-turn-helix domain-containing protein n=1 Tax=Streptomyces sp. NPDC050617 TaxID=3154628 RepID=UPI003449D3BA